MDPEHWQQIYPYVVAFAVLGLTAFFIIKGNKNASKRLQVEPLLGAYPRSPRPITVAMDAQEAKHKFIQGLNQLQAAHGWSVLDSDLSSSRLSATMRYGGMAVTGNRYANANGASSRMESVNYTITLTGEVISRGGQTLISWIYDQDGTVYNNPDRHESDPNAEDYCLETNYSIMQSLGLLEK
jgi:hypothetical protein